MPKAAVRSPTINEIALVAGTAAYRARNAVISGVLPRSELTWVDALVLRVHATAASLRLPGEFHRHRPVHVAEARARLAASVTRKALSSSGVPLRAQLIVTRRGVKLVENLAYAFTYLDEELSGLEPAQVLPVGQWWYDMQWRMEPELVSEWESNSSLPSEDPPDRPVA